MWGGQQIHPLVTGWSWRRYCRATLSVLALLVLASFYAGCQSNQTWRGLIKIGLAVPLTRYDSYTAFDALFAARLALSKWNANGGVGGYRVSLVLVDDENDGDVAEQRARELTVDPDVLAVVGHISNPPASRAATVYRSNGMAWFTFASATDLTLKGHAHRLGPNDGQVADAILSALGGNSGALRLAIVHGRPANAVDETDEKDSAAKADTGSDEGLIADLDHAVTARGGAEVWRGTLPTLDPSPTAGASFAPVIAGLRESQAEAIVFIGDYRQAAALYDALQVGTITGLEPFSPQFLAVGSDTPDFMRVGSSGSRGAMYIAPWPELSGDKEVPPDFASKFQAQVGRKPRHYATVTYEAINVALRAAERAERATGYPSRQGVLAELEGTRAADDGSWLAFDASGELARPRPQVYRIEDGYPGVALK